MFKLTIPETHLIKVEITGKRKEKAFGGNRALWDKDRIARQAVINITHAGSSRNSHQKKVEI